MAELRGMRVLTGSKATLQWNGKDIYECQAVNATVNVNRSEVQFGMSVDSKMVSASGDLTLQIYHVYTRTAQEALDSIKKGEDLRMTLISRIADPDAVGRQVESTTLENVWLNSFPLTSWTKGTAEAEEYTGGFTPTDAQINEAIKEM